MKFHTSASAGRRGKVGYCRRQWTKFDKIVKSTRNLRRALFSFHKYQKTLDSRFCGNDGKKNIRTFYETIKFHIKNTGKAPFPSHRGPLYEMDMLKLGVFLPCPAFTVFIK
jgi:hypothetical protein